MLEESLLEIPTTCLSDALDRLGLPGQVADVRRLSGNGFAGRAFTVRYGPVGTDGGTVGDYIEDVERGAVVVLDNGGRDDCTVWGGLLSEVASMRGVAGTLIDGVCRDIERAHGLGYPVYARGVWMRTGKDRVRVEAVSEPVSVGGVRVRPGDYVRADADGAVVVPADLAPDVIATAGEIHRKEEQIAAEIRAGSALRDARERHGYHALQTRRPGGDG
jgi:4-hydroxy-4-methyl-2-oxoglutarate aldolase